MMPSPIEQPDDHPDVRTHGQVITAEPATTLMVIAMDSMSEHVPHQGMTEHANTATRRRSEIPRPGMSPSSRRADRLRECGLAMTSV